MTKFTLEVRKELYQRVVNYPQVKLLRAEEGAYRGFPDPSWSIKNSIYRALGINKNTGKFHVGKERELGGKQKWQRYYAHGTPELFEYLARYAIIFDKVISIDPDRWIVNLPRGGGMYKDFIQFDERPEAKGSCEDIDEFISSLPDWGELYTDKGLNYFVVLILRHIVTGKSDNLPELEAACDKVKSPYRIKMCQGQARNDEELEGRYQLCVDMLTNVDTRERVVEEQAQASRSKSILKDRIALAKEQAMERKGEGLKAEIYELIERSSLTHDEVVIPNNIKELDKLHKDLTELVKYEEM